MADLGRNLSALSAFVDWPETPPVVVRLGPRHSRRPAFVAVAVAAVAAVSVAFAVPGARSAILRLLHLGGVTVQRVDIAPRAPERALTAGLGPEVDRARAAAALRGHVRLPSLATPRFYLAGGIVSVVLAAPKPVLLSEFRTGAQDYLLKKIAGSETNVAWVEVRSTPALWLSGGRHFLMVLPSAPPRLAGNVLIWQVRGITYRLEARALSKRIALRLAAEIDGT